ncbi:cytochrome P450 [Smaragdicoccus niigatensis]|uniref:cytochrome P450 n=1 Tax=Smaragdicoccus niigatensis TaxID=359359 RepID=UPI00039C23F6|nr:cytochrome P450 [Smaragdicoccus niigatensis]
MNEFPFLAVTANELPFRERDRRYAELHEWPEATFRHRSGLQLIWRYDDVREVLEAVSDGISNSNSLDPLVGFPRIMATPGAIPPFLRHLVPLPAKATANLTDHDLHKRVWNTMAGPDGHFTIGAGERADVVRELGRHFDAAIDAVTAGNGKRAGVALDVTAASIAYAARVTGSRVGLPQADWSKVATWSGAQSGLLGRDMRSRHLAGAVEALGQLFTVSSAALRGSPGADGFHTRLLDAGLPRRIAISTMANCLAAGVHTVSGSIQQGLDRLLSDPGRSWWSMLGEPTTAPSVIGKILQLDPGLVAWKRRAQRPLTLKSGTTLHKGPILAMFAAANRDPRAFPNCLDLGASGKLPLTFGFGRHVCPGKSLATVAIEVFLTRLYELAPEARLVTPDGTETSRPRDLLFSGADVVVA